LHRDPALLRALDLVDQRRCLGRVGARLDEVLPVLQRLPLARRELLFVVQVQRDANERLHQPHRHQHGRRDRAPEAFGELVGRAAPADHAVLAQALARELQRIVRDVLLEPRRELARNVVSLEHARLRRPALGARRQECGLRIARIGGEPGRSQVLPRARPLDVLEPLRGECERRRIAAPERDGRIARQAVRVVGKRRGQKRRGLERPSERRRARRRAGAEPRQRGRDERSGERGSRGRGADAEQRPAAARGAASGPAPAQLAQAARSEPKASGARRVTA
jgi:hypothetical protein